MEPATTDSGPAQRDHHGDGKKTVGVKFAEL